MNHWPFITAAYLLTLLGGGGIAIASFLAMRRAEDAAERMTRR